MQENIGFGGNLISKAYYYYVQVTGNNVDNTLTLLLVPMSSIRKLYSLPQKSLTAFLRSCLAKLFWSSRCLQDVKDVLETSSRLLQLSKFLSSKTPSRRLVLKSRRFQDIFKISWKTSSRRLEDVLEDKKLLSWRRLQDMSSRCRRNQENVYWEGIYIFIWQIDI